jgi:SAM-dependent methyltransferase
MSFPLFQTPIDLAHRLWLALLKPGDVVIDATCGNGHDALILAQAVLTADAGRLIGYDIQADAISATRQRLSASLTPEQLMRIELHCKSHRDLDDHLEESSVALIVYNLGYLPGSNKLLTTTRDTTLQSVRRALALIKSVGVISITCYPGHAEGAVEEEELLALCSQLQADMWSCCHHRWVNRRHAPSLLIIQKEKK